MFSHFVASPCLIVLAHNEAKIVSLVPRLPLGGKLSLKATDEGRSTFLIEIFHQEFSIKGRSTFLVF